MRFSLLHRLAQPAFAAALALAVCSLPLPAQNKGEPGRFDFYLMNLSWSPEFCSIQGVSPQCQSRPGFILHGLWAQNNDGSYPVFCSEAPGPTRPAENLDLTPDLALLHHEWDKHGTCANIGPRRFFALERKAYHALKVPPAYDHIDHEISLAPLHILGDFYRANPDFPQGSILLSCAHEHLTAIEACFSKDLHPIACKGLDTCHDKAVKVSPPVTAAHN